MNPNRLIGVYVEALCAAPFWACKPAAWVQSPSEFFVGRSVCVEPNENTSQDLLFGSGASPPWNKVQPHCHSHESELLYLLQDTTKPPLIVFANPKLVSIHVRCRCLPILVGIASGEREHMTHLLQFNALSSEILTRRTLKLRHPPQSQTPLCGTFTFRTPGRPPFVD